MSSAYTHKFYYAHHVRCSTALNGFASERENETGQMDRSGLWTEIQLKFNLKT